MKTKFYLMTMIALAMIACGERNTPSTPNGNGNGGGNSGGGGNGGGSTTKVEINFSYRVVKPFTVEFTNTSVGADSYKWDFGDGDYSSNKDVTHAYASTGTYTVTLTGTANGTKYDCRKKITIKKPAIYIAGYALYSIPYENKYYKVVCKDDDWFSTNWGFTTSYTPLLELSDIPYTKYFNSPLLMDALDGDNYYTFYVYYTKNSSNTNGDTQCLKKQLQKTEIYKYKDEHILTSDNGKTKLGILMHYEL